ncbi:MAG: hypothetical protein WCO10_02705 [bacterium]
MQPVQQIDAFHSYDLIGLLGYLAKAVYTSSTSADWSTMWRDFWAVLPDYVVSVMFNIFTVSLFLTILLLIFIVWVSRNLMATSHKLHASVVLSDQETAVEKTSSKILKATPIINERWQNVLLHLKSENPNDWKLAILEADVMLGDMMEKQGYMQDSIGEKLKAVEQSDFTSIEAAWEAHKIRNAIAHQGAEFMINKREVERVIGLYEAVFREFNWI